MTESHHTSAPPLDGLLVVDLSRVLSGPYCTMLLADMGARVIKIEQPGRGDDTRGWGPPFVAGESAYFLSVNRNKESLTLDFKHPEGRRILDALIERADVVVENFRPGTLDRLGLGYADVSPRRPGLLYCSISGFGQTGPRRASPGYDAVIQAEGGLMSITGPEDGSPHRLGVAIGDLVTGMFATQGILLALLARATAGRGQHIDVAMLDSVVAMLTYQAGIYFTTGRAPVRLGNRHPTIAPYETFETSDGELVLAVGNDEIWKRFCRVAGLDALAGDARFVTNAGRVSHYAELRPLVAAALRRRSRADWVAALDAAGVPAGSVRDLGEVFSDEHLRAREMVETVQHPAAGPIQVLGLPIKLSETGGRIRRPPPVLGEHTESILMADLGLDAETVARLRQAGAV